MDGSNEEIPSLSVSRCCRHFSSFTAPTPVCFFMCSTPRVAASFLALLILRFPPSPSAFPTPPPPFPLTLRLPSSPSAFPPHAVPRCSPLCLPICVRTRPPSKSCGGTRHTLWARLPLFPNWVHTSTLWARLPLFPNWVHTSTLWARLPLFPNWVQGRERGPVQGRPWRAGEQCLPKGVRGVKPGGAAGALGSAMGGAMAGSVVRLRTPGDGLCPPPPGGIQAHGSGRPIPPSPPCNIQAHGRGLQPCGQHGGEPCGGQLPLCPDSRGTRHLDGGVQGPRGAQRVPQHTCHFVW
eukprot:scaffold676_cov115-Isochrysis_galbana.AAC.22